MSFIFVVDGEMTGKRLTSHALIELGCIFMDLTTGETADKIDLIINIPEGRGWDSSVRAWMLQQPKLLEVVRAVDDERGVSVQVAMDTFVQFLRRNNDLVHANTVIAADHVGSISLLVYRLKFHKKE